MSRYLFIALSSLGWGEVSFASRIAMDLQNRGDEVLFFVQSAGSQVLKQNIPFEVVEGHGALEMLRIDDYIERKKPLAIILSDYLS